MNTKHSKLVEAVRPAIGNRDAARDRCDRLRNTLTNIEAKEPELVGELKALEAGRAETDTACLVNEEDLPEVTAEELEARRRIDRLQKANQAALSLIRQQIEAQETLLLEQGVAVSDAFFGWAGGERQTHASAIASALEKIANHAAQLRAVDLIQEALLGSPFRFTQPQSEWALTSGKWLADKLAGLPPELRPASLSSDRLEEVAQQHAAQLLAAIEEDEL